MKREFPCRWLVTVLVCAALTPLALGATTWQVSAGKTDVKGALTSIQEAVDTAAAGDTIVLSPGTYTGKGNGDVNIKGKALTIRSVEPLDANTVERTVIDCAGTPTDPHRGFSIVDCNGVVLSGLTIQHGLAGSGGAIYCSNSTLDVTYCQILNNATLPGGDSDVNGGSGGGLYAENSVVWVMGCFLSGNTTGSGASAKDGRAGAGGNGAGVYGVKSEVVVLSSTVTGNKAGAGGNSNQGPAGTGGDGGGLFGDSIRLVSSTVALNLAGTGGEGVPSGRGGQGGGLRAAAAVIDRCTIEANCAGDGGKALADAKSESGAGGDGGGLYADSLEIVNSLVTGNRAGRGFAAVDSGATIPGSGGGIWCAAGTISQCTIAGNVVYQAADAKSASVYGGQGAGVLCSLVTKVKGSILYGNVPDQLGGFDLRNVTYCNIKTVDDSSGKAGTIVPPEFLAGGRWVSAKDPKTAAEPNDPNAVWVQGDYRLQFTSPMIDAGDPNYSPGVSETDVAGNVRRADAAVDIGAFESQSRVPLYRFQSPAPDRAFYTASELEKDWVIQNYSKFWKFDGTLCDVFAWASDPNLRPVYRFWSGQLASHFYTISEEEKDRVIVFWPDFWEYDGPVFYAYPDGNQPKGTIPVYRFWSDAKGGHFYTTDETEKSKRAQDKAWIYEGIAWYAYPSPKAETVEPNAVYEFSGGAAEAQCTLSLKALLDGKEVKIDKPDIAVAFAANAGLLKMMVDSKANTTTLQELLMAGTLSAHSATVGDSTAIVLSGGITFWGQTARGPFGVDPNTQMFPTRENGSVPGSKDEKFTISGGSITVDGSKSDIGLVENATTFATGKPATFYASALPDQLTARLAGTFQWSYEGQPGGLLLETKVKDGVLQLYVASIQIQTTGVWQGKKL